MPISYASHPSYARMPICYASHPSYARFSYCPLDTTDCALVDLPAKPVSRARPRA
nr:unnamed protein product [Digitaria exilis]